MNRKETIIVALLLLASFTGSAYGSSLLQVFVTNFPANQKVTVTNFPASQSKGELLVLADKSKIQLNDTTNALIGIVSLNGHTQGTLYIRVWNVDVAGNMACRGDLGLASLDIWSFGALDCHLNAPATFKASFAATDHDLRLEVSGGGPSQPTWATGHAVISVILYLT